MEMKKKSNKIKHSYLFGIHPVLEYFHSLDLLNPDNKAQENAYSAYRNIEKVYISNFFKETQILGLLEVAKIPLERLSSKDFKQRFAHKKHQGIVLQLRLSSKYNPKRNWEQSIQESRGLIVLLDNIQDPQNLGSIIRSAESLGAAALFITGKGASINETVHKVASGASFHLPIFQLSNLNLLIDKLKQKGFWICSSALAPKIEAAQIQAGKNRSDSTPNTGINMHLHWDIEKLPPTNQLALILGNEGSGIQRLALEKSDYYLHIPMQGKIGSLNAACAAAILIDRLRFRPDTKREEG